MHFFESFQHHNYWQKLPMVWTYQKNRTLQHLNNYAPSRLNWDLPLQSTSHGIFDHLFQGLRTLNQEIFQCYFFRIFATWNFINRCIISYQIINLAKMFFYGLSPCFRKICISSQNNSESNELYLSVSDPNTSSSNRTLQGLIIFTDSGFSLFVNSWSRPTL